MITLRIKLYLLFAFLVCSGIQGQSEGELIKLHKENLKDLYAKRGAPPSWVKTGHVTDDYLLRSINHYKEPTAILIYTLVNDSLSVRLFNQENLKLRHKVSYPKEDLIEDVENVNLLFATSNEITPKLRGAIPIKKSKRRLEKSFKHLNEIILPSDFQLNKYKHLIIVPTLNISTLPIAAFKINNNYLIDLMSYSIAPSLFELMVSDKINNSHNSSQVSYTWYNALFVANPNYPESSIWQFPDLPGTIDEVESITKNFNPSTFKKLIGDQATKPQITNNICDYDLLYFATHGISNSENPMQNSFLVLTDSQNESPYLTLAEIMNWRYKCKLNADLVVLSACQTGLGKSHEGGIIGLARSFQIAGANHVIMSLWNIDDFQTANLMKLFFDELEIAQELMPHEALRQAILKYKREISSNPRYWAAFSIFGVPY